MWRKINEVLYETRKLKDLMKLFIFVTQWNDTTKVANKFNNDFTNVTQELLKKTRKNKQQVSGLPKK